MRHTKDELINFCKITSKCHAYPFHYFYNGELAWEFPIPPADLLSRHRNTLFHNSKTMALFQTKESLAYGLVRTPGYEHLIVAGPVPVTLVDFEHLHNIMKEYKLSYEMKEPLCAYLSRTSGYSLVHLQNVLSLLNFYLNEQNSETIMHSDETLNQEMLSMSLESGIQEYDEASYQAAYNYEKELLSKVKEGNVKGILDLGSTSMDMHVGIMSTTSTLRQLKDIFICTATLVTRAAIKGGLNLKTAYQLSDLYLQKAELTVSSSDLKKLSNTMILDFTERTGTSQLNEDIPFSLYECLQYIRRNTHISLRVDMLADHMHLSKSQLDRKFKNSLGFTPSEFILRCKLEEAKDLLKNTSLSIGEISQILCFSSQSHFSNAFKKKFNISPSSFREGSGLQDNTL